MRMSRRFVATAAVLLLAGGSYGCASRTLAAPVVPAEEPTPVSTVIVSEGRPALESARLPGRGDGRLRIMPLGDSITYGLGDPDLGSYRDELGRKLAAAGVEVDFVGSMRSGPAGTDRDNEGHIGWRIDQIAARADHWMATYRPQVVLLHIGTNDMRTDEKATGAAGRLSELIDQLLADGPEVHVVVARIVGSDKADYQRRIDAYNAAIPDLVATKGGRVHLADQHAIEGDQLGDPVHPNKKGYRAMAGNWFDVLDPS
ncbi:SGNH/GDSL hydrolase family protein [Actinoplanes sp. NPDC051633]|uniref:SGNH/GDSL hydrolase family protein n=1 Tax=Actinoplanes sp. NPDC051633 TaxID=3155670 RepID=UPI003415C980